MSENMVEISENSLAVLLSETEVTYSSYWNDISEDERERLKEAMEEARNALE